MKRNSQCGKLTIEKQRKKNIYPQKLWKTSFKHVEIHFSTKNVDKIQKTLENIGVFSTFF